MDVTVSSMGNAKSLRGGTLLLTPLKGVDGQVYAIAQGNLGVGGAGASSGGSKTTINQLSAGRIPNGATVERAVPTALGQGDFVNFELHDGDFGTAHLVSDAINAHFADALATAVDNRTIRVQGTRGIRRPRVIHSAPGRSEHRRTGAGSQGHHQCADRIGGDESVGDIDACAVAHGNLTVTINNDPIISQPAPFSNGNTVVVPHADIDIKQDGSGFRALPAGTKLADVVRALNTLGATPMDLLAILQAMKSAGALKAELEII